MDTISKSERSRNMSRIKSKNTGPELKLRKLLASRGFRYRVHSPLLGKPDIVFPSKRLAIFINGCFWHGHGCKVDHKSKSNELFWTTKIIKNKLRDKKNIELLKKDGWKSLVIWECELETDEIKSLNKVLYLLK